MCLGGRSASKLSVWLACEWEESWPVCMFLSDLVYVVIVKVLLSVGSQLWLYSVCVYFGGCLSPPLVRRGDWNAAFEGQKKESLQSTKCAFPAAGVNPASLKSSLKTQFWRKPKYTRVHLQSSGFPEKYEMKIRAYNGGAPSACRSGSCNVIHIDRGIRTTAEQVLLDIREGIISDTTPQIIALWLLWDVGVQEARFYLWQILDKSPFRFIPNATRKQQEKCFLYILLDFL